MDIQRPSNARAKKIRRIAYGTVALIIIGGVTYGLSKLRPAAPSVDRATIWPDEVKRGPMLREVRWGPLFPKTFAGSLRRRTREWSAGYCVPGLSLSQIPSLWN